MSDANIIEINGVEVSLEDAKAREDIETINTQLGDIAKQIENVGQPTQEQINTAIDKAITDGKITGGSGINSTAKTLLETILKNAIYSTDQSANITSLVSALSSGSSGGDTPTTTYYTITNTLTNCINGNSNSSVAENTSYIATITPNTGYKLDIVTITMGGTDVTSTVYNNGKITINSVTGNIVITAVANEKQVVAEMPTNGLVDLFDFRTCTYNNSGSGGSTLINATQGNGGLYAWANNCVVEQNAKYGINCNRALIYSANGTTTSTNANNSFTQIYMSYVPSISNPWFNSSYGTLSNLGTLKYNPTYKNTSNSNIQVNAEDVSEGRQGWFIIALVVDESSKTCKLYVNSKLVATHDGNNYDDFVSWSTTAGTKNLGSNNYLTLYALYNKALSEVEVTEAMAYLKTLEVNE